MTTPRQNNLKYVTQSEMSSFFIDNIGIPSVKSYGAVGDGVTDDTTKIQDAIDDAIANDIIFLFFPPGDYYYTGTFINIEQLTLIGINATLLGYTIYEFSSVFPMYNGALRQAIINGNFSVNQRAVSGIVTLAAGKYGHDRWKAGTSGCTYTFSTAENVTTITITSGSLQQVIEGTNLITGTYTLSWTGTAQGKIGTGNYGTSSLTGSATGGTNLTIEFGTGTLSKVQFNYGTIALPSQHKFYQDEFFNSRRYNLRLNATQAYTEFGTGIAVTTTRAIIHLKFPVSTRIAPTLLSSGNFRLYKSDGTAQAVTSIGLNGGANGTDATSLLVDVASGLTPGCATTLTASNDTSAYINFDAEL